MTGEPQGIQARTSFTLLIEWQEPGGQFWLQRYQVAAENEMGAVDKAIKHLTSVEVLRGKRINRIQSARTNALTDWRIRQRHQPLYELVGIDG